MMKFCAPCGGSGKMMGGGMLTIDCSQCKGIGKIDTPENDIDFLETHATELYEKEFKKEVVKQSKQKRASKNGS